MLETILSIINFIGALYLLQKGHFLNTTYFKFTLPLIVAYIIGVIFKITHFVFAHELITISSIAILLLYLKYFTKKPIKKSLEYLKLAWVISTFGISLIQILHLYPLDLKVVSPVIMVFTLFEYFRTERHYNL